MSDHSEAGAAADICAAAGCKLPATHAVTVRLWAVGDPQDRRPPTVLRPNAHFCREHAEEKTARQTLGIGWKRVAAAARQAGSPEPDIETAQIEVTVLDSGLNSGRDADRTPSAEE